MRAFLLSVILLIGAVGLAKSPTQSEQYPLPDQLTKALTRPSIFQPGGWTIIDCSDVAAARSAALNQWSRYTIQCGDASYLSWGTVTTTADANDGYIPADAWLEFLTTDTNIYVSCLNKTADSDCRIIEGK